MFKKTPIPNLILNHNEKQLTNKKKRMKEVSMFDLHYEFLKGFAHNGFVSFSTTFIISSYTKKGPVFLCVILVILRTYYTSRVSGVHIVQWINNSNITELYMFVYKDKSGWILRVWNVETYANLIDSRKKVLKVNTAVLVDVEKILKQQITKVTSTMVLI